MISISFVDNKFIKWYSAGVILISIIIVMIFSLNFSGITSATATDNITVDVNVTSMAEITILPHAINWTEVMPGTAGGERNISIVNTGSVNVTSIYSYMSTLSNETDRPYLSSNPLSYSAGGVLVYYNSTNSSYAWAGRLEWNWTSDITNIDYAQSGITAFTQSARGFYRNASVSYVWIVKGNVTNGRCNETGTILAISDYNDDGTYLTRIPNMTFIVPGAGNSNYGVFSVNRETNPLYGMCIAVNQTCDKIYIYKYDKRSMFPTCANSRFIRDNLAPNDVDAVVANIHVPKGMPSGDLKQAIWYFIGT